MSGLCAPLAARHSCAYWVPAHFSGSGAAALSVALRKVGKMGGPVAVRRAHDWLDAMHNARAAPAISEPALLPFSRKTVGLHWAFLFGIEHEWCGVVVVYGMGSAAGILWAVVCSLRWGAAVVMWV